MSHTNRPNIVLILVDDMGFSDIGCYGSEIATPNLDKLASEGLLFSQMYNCARCCPSRASLLTGLYPHQAGIGHMVTNKGHDAYQGYLNDRCITLAESLKGGGYGTYHVGKWHVGGPWTRIPSDGWRVHDPEKPLPSDRGFDEWYGIPTGGNYFNPSPLMHNYEFIEPPHNFYTTDAYTDEAVKMIEKSVSKQEPFFLHLCYNAPHWPLHAWPEDIEKYRGAYRIGWDELRSRRHEELNGTGVLDPVWSISPRDASSRPWNSLNEDQKQWESMRMAVYAAQIDRLDQGIGRVLAALEAHDVSEDTIVLFLSDNGGCAEFLKEEGHHTMELPFTMDGKPVRVGNITGLEPGPADTFMSYGLSWANASNSPFRMYKHWVHEGGISTPLIIRWPAAGTMGICHASSHLVDISATIREATGVPYPSEVDGRAITPAAGESFLSALNGEQWQRDTPIFFEHEGNRAVRDGQWKLVSRYPDAWELYDMAADRTELNNIIDLEREACMSAQYTNWADKCSVLPWPLRTGEAT